jgi:hypothetical protein
MTDYTPRDLIEMMIRAARDLETAQTELVAATVKDSEADRRYRQAKASAYLASSGTVGERDAYVNKSCDLETYEAHLAAGMAKAALEAVRNRRQVLSSLQSIAGAVKAEAEFARYESREARSA